MEEGDCGTRMEHAQAGLYNEELSRDSTLLSSRSRLYWLSTVPPAQVRLWERGLTKD